MLPSPSVLAVWREVREELLAAATLGARMWLTNVRLLRLLDGRVVVSSPPLGKHASLTERYRQDIAALLGQVLGREVEVAFQPGW